MSKDILQAMMPGVQIYEANMTEGGHPTVPLQVQHYNSSNSGHFTDSTGQYSRIDALLD